MTHIEANEILTKHGINADHRGALPPLGGSNRARVRAALNFIRNNPPAKKARKKAKKADN